jgi:prevent-host-death family protein
MIRKGKGRGRKMRGNGSAQVPVAEAKARFAEQMRRVESGEPVVITRHGTPVVAMVPVEDLMALRRLRAAGPQGGLASVAGGWEGSEVLARRIHDPLRSASRAPAQPGLAGPSGHFDLQSPH